MRNRRMILGLAACSLALSACMPTLQGLGSPGLEVRGACSPIARQSRSAMAFGQMQRVNAIQARYSLGARYARANPAGWMQLASGECR
jgi:hypothetical protein